MKKYKWAAEYPINSGKTKLKPPLIMPAIRRNIDTHIGEISLKCQFMLLAILLPQ